MSTILHGVSRKIEGNRLCVTEDDEDRLEQPGDEEESQKGIG
jgi:hypothetical protein